MRFDRVTTSEKFTKFFKKQIFDGIYRPNQKIPSERELSEKYKISRPTIHKILSTLVAEGILFRNQNKGTYISPSQHTELTVYATKFPEINYSDLVRIFEKKHPEVKVKLSYYSARDLEPDVNNNFLKKIRDFDLILLYDATVGVLVKNQILADLTEYTSTLIDDEICSMPGSPFVINQKRYGVPFIFSPIMILCNKELFNERGISVPTGALTWKKFSDLARKLTLPEKGQYGFSFRHHMNRWPSMILKLGGEIFDKNGNCLIDSPATEKAFKFLCNYVHNSKISPSPIANVIRLFCEGKVAMFLDSAYSLERYNEYGQFPLGAIPVPGPRGNKTGLLATGFGIRKGSKRKKFALEFIKTALTREFQKKLCLSNRGIPIRKGIVPNKSIKKEFIKELPHSRIILKNPWRSEIFKLLGNQLPMLWSGMQKPEIVLKQVAEDIRYGMKNGFKQLFKWDEVI